MNETTSHHLSNTPGVTVIRTYEFELFKLWRSIPYFLKSPPKDKSGGRLTPLEFAESMGIDDPDILDLVQIRTQTEFADKFSLQRRTLWEWGKIIDQEDPIKPLQEFALKLAKNVVLAMYNNALSTKNLNADRDRMNFVKISGWVEKKQVDIGMANTLADYIRKQAMKKKENDNRPTSITGAN